MVPKIASGYHLTSASNSAEFEAIVIPTDAMKCWSRGVILDVSREAIRQDDRNKISGQDKFKMNIPEFSREKDPRFFSCQLLVRRIGIFFLFIGRAHCKITAMLWKDY